MMTSTPGRDPLRSRIPITVLTGFLGSGKTTLLNALLRRPEAAHSAVIVNEFGEVGIDHDLVQGISGAVTLLDNGCVCCVLRGDLEIALENLFQARRNGEIASFERVILETTGLADPAPIMQTVLSNQAVTQHYRLDCVVTVVDGVQGRAQIESAHEAVKQAAVADRLVITKSDLAGEAAIADLCRTLAEINPAAGQAVAVSGAVEPDFVLGVGPDRTRLQPAAIDRWLGPVHDGHEHQHIHGISTFTLWFDQPFQRASFDRCIELLISLRGSDLLRVKGLLNVAGEPGPVVIQGVQHLFHPPVTLAAWPGPDRRSRLVFITRGIERDTVERLFAVAAALQR